MYTLPSGDYLLSPEEYVEGVAVARVLGVRHGVEGPRLHISALDLSQMYSTSLHKQVQKSFLQTQPTFKVVFTNCSQAHLGSEHLLDS